MENALHGHGGRNEAADGQAMDGVESGSFDYSRVASPARIALYDDLLSAPRIVEIPPGPTHEFINALASEVYNSAHAMGGGIPYTAVKQVAENFIHARFREVVVSVLDGGNTIRFTDQGPGIADKAAAQRPGFSSATEEMKRYIDGVGSGLPIVREYLDVKHGELMIEDNLNGGSVITLSMGGDHGREETRPARADGPEPAGRRDGDERAAAAPRPEFLSAALSRRGRDILPLFLAENTLGVQEISTMADIPLSSTHSELKKLEEAGLIERIGKKRSITSLGSEVARTL